jgi:4-carboxymuconolactone decarboxylase
VRRGRLLGETQVVEAVGTAGYYTTLAIVMNVGRTPPPPDAPRLPPLTRIDPSRLRHR